MKVVVQKEKGGRYCVAVQTAAGINVAGPRLVKCPLPAPEEAPTGLTKTAAGALAKRWESFLRAQKAMEKPEK